MPSIVSLLNKGLTYEFDDSNNRTLLESIEDQGVKAPYNCRAGHCGRCAVKIVSGQVHYHTQPLADVPKNHALSCCCQPKTLLLLIEWGN